MKVEQQVQELQELIIDSRRALVGWMLFCTFLIIVILGFKYRLSTQIDADIIATQKLTQLLAEKNEKSLAEFADRTIKRWDSLRLENPDMKVPIATEPAPKPLPTPAATPR